MSPARSVRVTGVVQGVGFRPFVWRLAQDIGLRGWVRNDAAGVDIHLEGGDDRFDAFIERLRREAPPLSRIDGIEAHPAAFDDCAGFAVLDSEAGRVATAIGPDAAICPDCLAEMFDPAGRRWRHAFITCTHCGPRYTVTRALPYDRPQTSLAGFPLCPACEREYRDPADRRFHAETTCCPDCGPRLRCVDAAGDALAGDPVAAALGEIRRGRIVAVKGLGGFHLCCDANDAEAVARLRARKHREEKPFAVMLANVDSIAAHAEVSAAEQAALESRERPIVLLRKRAGADDAFSGVAPGIAWIGAMLPYTPLHWLLFHEGCGRPAGTDWTLRGHPLALVMTSANPGGEPIVRDDAEALARLAGIADAWLLHDRDVVSRCDDSVVRLSGGAVQAIRRSRGFVPRAIRLPAAGPSVLAFGAHLKNTVCVTRGGEAFVSQHVGDLDNAATCDMLDETVGRLLRLLDVEPEAVAHDLHPDYRATQAALAFAQERGLPTFAVQHHHAHIAAVAAERGRDEPLLGLALDGVGFGADGGIWGGELLRVDGMRCERLGHLRELPLPGGDRAAREPWRMAAALLHALGRGDEIERRFPGPAAGAVREMLARGIQSPPTSSCGRWFDAVAGLLGVKPVAAFEGQAAMLLEGLAERAPDAAPDPDGYAIGGDGTLDLLRGIPALLAEPDAAMAAARFHATLAAGLAEWLRRASEATGVRAVALGGGCFMNRILSHRLEQALATSGIEVLQAGAVPPNDGGLSLGQAWVACRR